MAELLFGVGVPAPAVPGAGPVTLAEQAVAGASSCPPGRPSLRAGPELQATVLMTWMAAPTADRARRRALAVPFRQPPASKPGSRRHSTCSPAAPLRGPGAGYSGSEITASGARNSGPAQEVGEPRRGHRGHAPRLEPAAVRYFQGGRDPVASWRWGRARAARSRSGPVLRPPRPGSHGSARRWLDPLTRLHAHRGHPRHAATDRRRRRIRRPASAGHRRFILSLGIARSPAAPTRRATWSPGPSPRTTASCTASSTLASPDSASCT